MAGRSVADGPRPDHLDAQPVEPGKQPSVRRGDSHLMTALHGGHASGDDLVVALPRSMDGLDGTQLAARRRPLGDPPSRLTLEDEDYPLVRQLRGHKVVVELRGRRCPVAPPPVRDRAHDVGTIDDEHAHGSIVARGRGSFLWAGTRTEGNQH